MNTSLSERHKKQYKEKDKARAYVLLRIADRHSTENAVKILGRSGVTMVDKLEESSGIMLVIEAPNRLKLTDSVMHILRLVEKITGDVEVFPVQNQ